jgi:hypothetical protein
MSIFYDFFNWLYDKNLKSELPSKDELLKYNSPITPVFLMKVFINSPKIVMFFDQHINNMNAWYVDKEEFFRFFKKCIIDFKIKKDSQLFYQQTRKHELLEKLKSKVSILKNDDLMLLCEMVERSKDKDSIYSALGITKAQKTSEKKKKGEKISLQEFIDSNFSIIRIEQKNKAGQ